MVDESQQPTPQPVNSPVSSAPLPPQPKKSDKYVWIIAAAALGLFCLSLLACLAMFGVAGFKVYTEKAPVEKVLDAYMRNMADKNAKNAYALFSPRAQRQIPVSKIEEMLKGNNYFLFEGYQSLSVSNLNISAAANTNPNAPQGTVARVTGVVNYEGDIQGTFNGVLEKVGDKWMIDGIYVTVPASKFK